MRIFLKASLLLALLPCACASSGTSYSQREERIMIGTVAGAGIGAAVGGAPGALAGGVTGGVIGLVSE